MSDKKDTKEITKFTDPQKKFADATLAEYEEILHGKKVLPVFRRMIMEFLDTPYSDMVKTSEFIPGYRVNLYRFALLKILNKDEIEFSGNFDGYGSEDLVPPEFTLFSTGDEELEGIAEGVMFLKRNGTKFIMAFAPTWGGSVMTLIGLDKKDLSAFILEIEEFISENNFLKGKKIDAFGQFLKLKDYTWDDIIIPSKIRKDICTYTLDYIKMMPELAAKGLPVKRGILLTGPPGNGKTLIGKILASASDCTFIWVPSNETGYEHVFKMARELSPSIVFMEDIASHGGMDRRQVVGSDLSGLLNMLDGVEENSYVITLATENYPELLDAALRSRPGRFDVRLKLDNPGYDQRESILRHYLSDVDFERIKVMASKTSNYSCAHLRELAARIVIQSEGPDDDLEIVQDISTTFEIEKKEQERLELELAVHRKKDRKKKDRTYTKQLENEGVHDHPHDQDGLHNHENLPEGGSHNHENDFGMHWHKEGDPLEGGHPNGGTGMHRHMTAEGLEEAVVKITDAHYPVHKWIPNFKQAWIRHEGAEEFRTTDRSDWEQHARFSLHSAGCSIVDHMMVFNNEETRLLELRYELEDGTVFSPGQDEWEKECEWFAENLPEVEAKLPLEDTEEKRIKRIRVKKEDKGAS